MKLLLTKKGGKIWILPDGQIHIIGDFDIDCDGSGGNPDGDPYFQPDTTLHHADGTALNAYRESFIVLPPDAIRAVKPMVLGSQAWVRNLRNGLFYPAVVGDVGPLRKTGEGSPCLARKLGLNSNANTGGTSAQIIDYFIQPGVPAVVDGITYKLQPFHG